MEVQSQVEEKVSHSDEDGIYQDSEGGCELAKVTISSERPESIPAERTSNSPQAWLVDVWRHHKKKPEFSLMMGDWIQKYPDLAQLIKESTERGEIDAFPSRAELPDCSERIPSFYDIIIKPDTLRILENQPLAVHRQRTVNGHEIDMRSEWGLALAKGDVPSLCGAAQMMLNDLAETDDLSTKTKIRIKLTHLIGCYGSPIKAQDPDLYERMLATPGAAKRAEDKGRW